MRHRGVRALPLSLGEILMTYHWTYVMALGMVITCLCVTFGWITPPDFNKFVTVGLLYVAGVVTAIWGKLNEMERTK